MSLGDYLAKNYGPASGKQRKSKRRGPETPTAHGVNVVVTDDDDSVRGVAWPGDVAEEAPTAAKPRFKDAGSSWRTVTPATADPVSELLGAAAGDEDGPAIAEGADLVREYQAQQREKDEEKKRLRLERQRQKEAQEAAEAAAMEGTGNQPAPASRSPSPAPMRYGLLTAATVKEDADRAQASHMRRLRELGDDVSGRNAGTIYRDAKTGKKINVDEARQAEQEKSQRRERLRLQHAEWNKGLVQQREKLEEQRLVESMKRSGSEPDGRKELEAEQRARQHWDDPALQFLENKRAEKHAYPVYKGYAPPNRFGIRPGYRWDGVDRSNGFERELFERQAATSARKADAYANSVADW
ncbi:Pre-mRNA-splicing factor cwc26 [Coemansia biformis]|uniref:Pre-mRNA-splicing factor cwc26 n=1 Tax=Coemansia biformis TaxID=1286918 RepID=A0A9W7YA79_9FUNG|nr:Pre-mRNA-splicing factor cwc26 [Coemansia biformis]